MYVSKVVSWERVFRIKNRILFFKQKKSEYNFQTDQVELIRRFCEHNTKEE